MTNLVTTLAAEFDCQPWQVEGALRLFKGANTIPFVARYRKEQTGSLDEVALRDLSERAEYLEELDQRRTMVLETIAEQGKLTDDLKARIEAAPTKQVLEDLYLPYRPKRRTRSTMAREKGLEPLATALFAPGVSAAAARAALQEHLALLSAQHAALHPAGEAEALTADEVLAGARDIQAEIVAEDAAGRTWMRERTWELGALESVVTKDFAAMRTKFSDYYAFSEPLKRIPPHRYLALRRGENEKVLRVRVAAPEAEIHEHLQRTWCPQAQGWIAEQWDLVLEDAYRRLIASTIEVDLRLRLKEQAERESVALFAENMAHLLLEPPGGQKVVLGLDPGFRTGSKWVVIDATGQLLKHGTIYPLPPQNKSGEAARDLLEAAQRYKVQVIAVGNGTASRELLDFVRRTFKGVKPEPQALLVSETGASVYSASDLAREEFPELDVSVRGAVSIARRWQDPLAELVKIDPKSIGVGQYQHDVNQPLLKRSLDATVESCVNRVGVHLNTASWALLRYVAGLSATQAREVVHFRDEHGAFAARKDLALVPRLGPKAFEQCAGFLRIPDGPQPLDGTAVHPEHYGVVEAMAKQLGLSLQALIGDEQAIARIDPQSYVSKTVGLPTIEDILTELRKPGRDPRGASEAVQFAEGVTEIAHLRMGMKLTGVVTNVTHFGAFVDLGVHQDGLVHISQLADRFVKNPVEVVRVGQAVQVTVLSVDVELGRIALSMKSEPDLERGVPGAGPTAGAGSPARQGRDAKRSKAPAKSGGGGEDQGKRR